MKNVKQTGEALKAPEVKVKSKHPWLPEEGTINVRRWSQVGDVLQDFYSTFGLDKVPVTAFSYFSLIRELRVGNIAQKLWPLLQKLRV